MCLDINETVQLEFDPDGTAVVYKFVDPDWGPPCYGGEPYVRGQTYSSNRTGGPALTEREVSLGGVDHGVHVMHTHESAEAMSEELSGGLVIRLRVRREHLVASGHYGEHECSVFTEAFVLDEEPTEVEDPGDDDYDYDDDLDDDEDFEDDDEDDEDEAP